MSGPTFELPPGWDEMARRLAQQFEPMRTAVAASTAPFERIRVQLEAHQARMLRWAPALEEIGRRLAESWSEAMPPNWEGYDGTEQVSAVIERVDRTGYCLVWLPGSEVLHEVMAADESETAAILLRHGAEVLDDASALLDEVDEPEFEAEWEAAAAAVRGFREGHTWSAQALGSSVFSSILHRRFERSFGEAVRRMEETDPENAAIQEVRLRTIYVAGARAMSHYDPWTDEPVRAGFNRHNTAHRITRDQWTEANALGAIMLIVAFLRELEYWAERRRRDIVDAA